MDTKSAWDLLEDQAEYWDQRAADAGAEELRRREQAVQLGREADEAAALMLAYRAAARAARLAAVRLAGVR